jgi:sulfide:quinone oxidoreductase
VIRAVLLGAGNPVYLSARLSGGHRSDSQLSAEPSWSPPAKIAPRYLAPYLESIDGGGAG